VAYLFFQTPPPFLCGHVPICLHHLWFFFPWGTPRGAPVQSTFTEFFFPFPSVYEAGLVLLFFKTSGSGAFFLLTLSCCCFGGAPRWLFFCFVHDVFLSHPGPSSPPLFWSDHISFFLFGWAFFFSPFSLSESPLGCSRPSFSHYHMFTLCTPWFSCICPPPRGHLGLSPSPKLLKRQGFSRLCGFFPPALVLQGDHNRANGSGFVIFLSWNFFTSAL